MILFLLVYELSILTICIAFASFTSVRFSVRRASGLRFGLYLFKSSKELSYTATVSTVSFLSWSTKTSELSSSGPILYMSSPEFFDYSLSILPFKSAMAFPSFLIIPNSSCELILELKWSTIIVSSFGFVKASFPN